MTDAQADNAIRARINGRDMVLSIPRDQLRFVEAELDQSAFAIFKAFGAGVWRADHVRVIVAFSATNGLTESQIYHAQFIGAGRAHKFIFHGRKPDALQHVEHALASFPIAPYSILARMLLGAPLFGLKRDEAVFSDEEVDAVG